MVVRDLDSLAEVVLLATSRKLPHSQKVPTCLSQELFHTIGDMSGCLRRRSSAALGKSSRLILSQGQPEPAVLAKPWWRLGGGVGGGLGGGGGGLGRRGGLGGGGGF